MGLEWNVYRGYIEWKTIDTGSIVSGILAFMENLPPSIRTIFTDRHVMSDKNNNLWGIDLGGTKAEGIVIGPGGLNEILFRDRVPTGAENGYEHILNQIKKLVDMMEAKMGYRPAQLGICTPGTLDPGTR